MTIQRTLIAAGLALALAGCTAPPIYNVDSNPVNTTSGKTPSAAQVRGAIIAAGAGLGWQMTDKSPGVLEGRLALRTHVAVVDIPYSEKAYSIRYRSSVNLNEANGTIHSNYNGWIQNLQRAVNSSVLALN